ncbi:MAG: mobile mystery protein A, partial [Gammaproteobacteria bacterium]|nr:mobile mystery protein A [Gammaproteobacteria bacterium]
NLLILKQLDQDLTAVKETLVQSPPKQGWVRTLRKALGMTIKQLARRLDVDPSRVVKIETSEIKGGITLRTLHSVARAFNCIFVYRFIPQTSFEEIIKQQAKTIASRRVQRTAETMDLEAQSVDQKWLEEQIRLAADELLRESWKHLWDEDV